MVFCLPATSSSLLLLTCHLLTGNDFVIENLSQADATATKHVAPQMQPRRPQLGQMAKTRQQFEAKLEEAKMEEAKMEEAKLEEAKMEKSKLEEAKLEEAKLQEAFLFKI